MELERCTTALGTSPELGTLMIERLHYGADTWRLRWAVGRLRSISGAVPSRATLLALIDGWEDEEHTTDVAFLDEVARAAAEARGPILEYGSGVTTILLAGLLGPRGIPVWTVEPAGERYGRMSRTLAGLGLSVRLCRMLKDRNTVVWSDPPLGEFPAQFGMVVSGAVPWNGEEIPGDLRARVDVRAVVLQVGAHRVPAPALVASGQR